MPRIRHDNDARYALRASFVDANGDVIGGDTIVIDNLPSEDPRISNTQISNWDTAYSWGNHASAGYLTATTWTDNSLLLTRGTAVPDTAGDSSGLSAHYLSYNATNKPPGTDHSLLTLSYDSDWQTQIAADWREGGQLYIRSQSDGTWSAWANVWDSTDFSSTSISNWDTAYGWGNHASAGYFPTSGGTLTGDLTVDNVTLGGSGTIAGSTWANGTFHCGTASAGWAMDSNELYNSGTAIIGTLAGNLELKPSGSVKAFAAFSSTSTITASGGNSTDWNTAYGWGNHASAGYLTAVPAAFAPGVATELSGSVNLNDLNAAQAGFYVQSQNADTPGNNYPVSQAGSLLVQKSAGNATQMYITYNGSSTELYFRANYTGVYGAWRKAWDDSDFSSTNVSNWNTAYGWGNHGAAGYLSASGGTVTGSLTVNGVVLTNEVRCRSGQQLVLNAGESSGYASGQTSEFVYANAESGLQVNSSPDNWSSGWAGRNTATICDPSGQSTFPAQLNVTGHGNSSQWNTAYGWGNHASAGYATPNSITDVVRASGGRWTFKSRNQMNNSNGVDEALQVYADNGNDAFMTFHVGGDHATNFGLENSTNRLGYGGYSTGATFYKFHSTQDFPAVHRSVTGSYGSIEIDGGAAGGYEGYSIGGRAVFMHDNGTTTGIYNDVDNQWILRGVHNGQTDINHAGSTKGYTYTSGFRVNGNLLATSDVYAYYSDERLKDVVGAIESPLESIGAIETFYYTHNDKARELGYEGSERQVGVSAQSVQAVLPEVVGRAPIDDDGEGGSVTGEDYMTVKYERIVPLLIEGIKDLTRQLESVKLELKEIKGGD